MKRLLSTSTLVLAHVFGRLALLASAIEAERGRVVASVAWGAATAAVYVVVRLVAGLLRARYEVELSRSLLEHVFRSRLFEPLRQHH